MFPWRIYRVAGHSMEPALKAGQYVVVRCTTNIATGDIIVCQYDGKTLIKRVKEKTPDGVLVSSDSPHSLDSRDIGQIYSENILGKVILAYRS